MALAAVSSATGIANKTIDNQLGGTEAERRSNYINDKEVILKDWLARIDKLEGKAQLGAPLVAKVDPQNSNQVRPGALSKSVAQLKTDYNSAKRSLSLLRDVRTDEEWGEGSTALEAKLRDMDSTYSHAMAE